MSSSRSRRSVWFLSLAGVALAGTVGCGGGTDEPDGPTVAFELDGPLAATTFYDFPFPSDLRLTADGKLDVAGFPNDRNLPVLSALLSGAAAHRGTSVSPITYFRFTAPTPAYSVDDMIDDVIPADPASPAWILDVDPDSDERGTLYPSMAVSFAVDDFAPANLVAVATRPGIVLAPDTTYAVVLTRAFAPEHVPPKGFADLAAGRTPAGARGAAAADLYQPLWDTLPMIGKTADDLLVASVFTTGDEVKLMRERSELVRDAYDAELAAIAVDADDGAEHELFCELRGTVTMPVLQRGEPPYNTLGDFEFDADGTPVSQGEVTFPISITLPNQEMPVGGWPLVLYTHGSGGSSRDLVDEGPNGTTGQGPGYVLARYGIAGASMAMPVQGERYPGATSTEYINLGNLAAFPFTFQTGVYESRLFLDELVDLEIEPATVATCTSLSLPAGETTHHFNSDQLMGAGHSMGGMYTNLTGAVEERWGALVPLGAGGFWNQMILITDIIDDTRGLLAALFGSEPDALSFAYPPLGLLGTAWEIAEPGAFVPRLAQRPLPGIPVHDVYTPVGINDIYFPNAVYDSVHLAYGNQQAGTEIWPEMQEAMALGGWDGLADYPVSGNRMGPDGQPHTRVVVQFPESGGVDSHQIYRTNEAVMRQYGCFLRTYLDEGIATVPDEGTLDDPCQ
jgi:hypothetical protein